MCISVNEVYRKCIFIFTESWFPGATGLEFMDKNVPHPCTVVERDTERGVQFLEPRGGWAKEDRVFRVICPGVKVDAATAQDCEGELLYSLKAV